VADVAAMARPVLTHRMSLSFAARARGESLSGLIDRVADRTLKLGAAA
jgi:MoxR-like ATPase